MELEERKREKQMRDFKLRLIVINNSCCYIFIIFILLVN